MRAPVKTDAADTPTGQQVSTLSEAMKSAMVNKKRKPRSEAVGRWVTMSPRLRAVLLKQREAFVQKFGREPGLTEPVFFDPSADDPQPLDADEVTAGLLDACERAGLDPDQVFSHLGWGQDLDAYRKKIQ